MKKWLLSINLVGLFVIGALAFGIGPVPHAVPSEPTRPLVIHSAAAPPVLHLAPTAFHIGDIQQLNGVTILLNNVYTVDGKYIVADFTVTNRSGAILSAVWLRKSAAIYVDGQDWRGPLADTFSDIPVGATQTGHVEFAWSNPEVIDTVRCNGMVWYL